MTDITKYQIYFLYLFLSIIFLFQPLSIIIITIILSCISRGSNSKKYNILFFALCSILFLAFINALKIKENDLINYIAEFVESGKTSLFNFVNSQKKNTESGYYIYEWTLNHLISSKEWAFKFFTTIVEYTFLTIASYKFCKKLHINDNAMIISLIITLFNPYVFSLSMQLVRQSLAVSIFIYVMVNRCLYNKTNWFLICLCPLIHTITAILILFLFIPLFNKSIKQNLLSYGFIVCFLIFIKSITGYLLTIPFIAGSLASYALERASAETSFDLGAATPATIGLAFLILAASFYLVDRNYLKESTQTSMGIKHIFNISLMISIFVLLNIDMSEIFYRFLMLLYPFIALIFTTITRNIRFKPSSCGVICIGILTIFLYLTFHGVWTYQGLEKYLFSGITCFL